MKIIYRNKLLKIRLFIATLPTWIKMSFGILFTLGIVSLQFLPDSFWVHHKIITIIAFCLLGIFFAMGLLFVVYKIVGDIRDYLLHH
jgi:hypothetical protein